MSDPGYFQGFDCYGIPAILYGLPDGERREVLTMDQLEPEEHDYWPDLVNVFVVTAPEPIGYAVVREYEPGHFMSTGTIATREAAFEARGRWAERTGFTDHRVVELRPIPEGEPQ